MDILTTAATMTVETGLQAYQSQFAWILIVGFILAFILGFGMGANDVANAFGTSVGSRVLSLRTAYILATIVETAGAILVGYNVTDTMRKGVVDTSMYSDNPSELLIGQIAILGGGGAWLILATILQLPVSTTHSIVGATLGFTLLARGTDGIHWKKVIEIAISWVLSPLLAGLVSATLYMILDFAVLRRKDPIKCGLRALPVFFFFCIAFNSFAVTYQGSKILGLSQVPLWMALVISSSLGFLASTIVHVFVRPRIIAWVNGCDSSNTDLHVIYPSNGAAANQPININNGYNSSNGFIKAANNSNGSSLTEMDLNTDTPIPRHYKNRKNPRHQSLKLTPKGIASWFFPHRNREEDPRTVRMFATIQVFTACFAGFAHGANDVANAIAPLTALLAIYKDNSVAQNDPTPIYILIFGVSAICVGLWALGHRVIRTIGHKLSEINPCSGFTIEFGAAVTALVCSKLGLPISTTHCLVGSIVAVGTVKSGEGIKWKVFLSCALSWIVTLPVSALFSAGIMWTLQTFVVKTT